MHDPIEDDFEDHDDPFDYNAPSKLQKMLPWIMVFVAYLLTVGGVAAVYLYLDSNAEQIEQELIDQRPTNLVEQIKIKQSSSGETQGETQGETEKAKADEKDATSSEQTATTDMQQADQKTETPLAANNGAAIEGDDGSEAQGDASNAANSTPSSSMGQEDTVHAVRELVPHPAPGLTEETPEGLLPIVAADGRAPWRIYARPFNSFETRPKIAIVMTGLGISESATEKAMELPGPITFAFAPYAHKLPDWITMARSGGHEVMLTLPMEPNDFPKSDPGPYALMTTLDAEQNTKKLNWILTRATGYIGLLSYQGDKFLASEASARLLSARLKPRGLLYMDMNYSPINLAPQLMAKNDVPYLASDEIVDLPVGRSDVIRKLAKLEEIAKTKGVAIAVAHPYGTTVKEIKSWTEELNDKGIALVPVSSVAIEKQQN